MSEKISIIGGDLRIVKLVNLLENEEFTISTFGLENSEDIKEEQKSNSIESCLKDSKIVISSIPFSKDDIHINSSFSSKDIKIEELFDKMQNVKFVAGAIKQTVKEKIKENQKIEIIDILESEQLTIKNAIPTAEGAIQIAMEQSYKTLHGSNVLVMGFGRIGKILAKMLNGIGANVYCEARKSQDIAWIKAYGYNAINLKEINKYLPVFDFIFNTIPVVILDKTNLKMVKKDCLILDLASKPGGLDYEVAEQLKIKTNWALGLPR